MLWLSPLLRSLALQARDAPSVQRSNDKSRAHSDCDKRLCNSPGASNRSVALIFKRSARIFERGSQKITVDPTHAVLITSRLNFVLPNVAGSIERL